MIVYSQPDNTRPSVNGHTNGQPFAAGNDSDTAVLSGPAPTRQARSQVIPDAHGDVKQVNLVKTADAGAPAPKRAKKQKRPTPSDPRKMRWNKKHFAFQQGKIRTSGWRMISQAFWTLLIVALGWQFIQFVDASYSTAPGSGPLPTRPPGVEGFLPISGLMGALDWVFQGELNPIHPAATILFLLFVGTAFIFRKSFCSWICPVGFLSEWLAKLGRWIFGKNVKPWAWLDFVLRGLKYLILGFFAYHIFTMGAVALNAFIMSPYNQVSDIKMLEFFRHLSKTSAIVIVVLAAGSVVIEGFWCRYLCPYGALFGIFSWFSPVKVRRDDSKCTDCKLCDKACPAKLIVSKRDTITKVECVGCHDCVSSCPVPGALRYGTKKRNVHPKWIAVSLVVALVVVTGLARLGGVWHNQISDDQIRHHVKEMNSAAYTHPGREYTGE